MSDVYALTDRGIRVLSPADPRVVDQIGPFLFVASDLHRSVRLVQDRHLSCIAHSDLVWLVCPDGYIGQSAAMELGFALAEKIPVFCRDWPSDVTLRQYVQKVESIDDAIRTIQLRRPAVRQGLSLLVDPAVAIETAHAHLDQLSHLLASPAGSKRDVASEVTDERQQLQQILLFPVD